MLNYKKHLEIPQNRNFSKQAISFYKEIEMIFITKLQGHRYYKIQKRTLHIPSFNDVPLVTWVFLDSISNQLFSLVTGIPLVPSTNLAVKFEIEA